MGHKVNIEEAWKEATLNDEVFEVSRERESVGGDVYYTVETIQLILKYILNNYDFSLEEILNWFLFNRKALLNEDDNWYKCSHYKYLMRVYKLNRFKNDTNRSGGI
jgi:hypothetical protein